MRVGIFHYLSTAYSINPAVLAQRAEELGFDSFWLPEHPIMPVTTVTPYPLGGPIPDFFAALIDPFVGLARASTVTKTIKLGTGICLVPERNPLLLAKEIATLDHFSGGRFLFGIGAGWLKEETEIMGGDFAHRWTQTQEAILAMKALWTQEEAEYHGRYYDFPPRPIFPEAGPEAASAHHPGFDYIPPCVPTYRGVGRWLDACRGQPRGDEAWPRDPQRTGSPSRSGPAFHPGGGLFCPP
jgi:alkanesulfonate monooxygenase SsuD/methylene tetrahydromethanopterin reductase-like flavin-dependent oxidoreductase (luciferase family)